MKTLLTAAIALSLLGGTAASAQPYGHANGHDRDDRRQEQRSDRHDDRRDNKASRASWRQGQRLPASYRTRGHYVDYRQHHLRQPPRGYQWVQADNNYVLVALTSGLIASIIASN